MPLGFHSPGVPPWNLAGSTFWKISLSQISFPGNEGAGVSITLGDGNPFLKNTVRFRQACVGPRFLAEMGQPRIRRTEVRPMFSRRAISA
jgi:hypothetical protein